MNLKEKNQKRQRRHARIRARVQGTMTKPRLCVFKSNQHIYAQLVDDANNKTLASNSSLELMKKKMTKTETAAEVGKLIAVQAKDKKVSQIVFDRSGFKYHGRVKALAEAARKAGLKF